MGERRPTIGWGRAVLVSLAVVVVAAAALVFLPNWVLTELTGLSRDARVAIATTGFVVLVGVCTGVLRRLQGRGVI